MIRRDFLIAVPAVVVTMCIVAAGSPAQSTTTAAPNAPVSISPAPTGVAPVSTEPPPPPQEQQPLGPSGLQAERSATGNTSSSATTSGGGSGGWVVQTMLALGLVIALIFALRWLLKRLTGWGGATGAHRADALVEVLARSTIAPKTSVLFLKIHERIVVAGQTPAGLDTLTEFDDPDQVAAILTQIQAARPHSISRAFGSLLKQADKDYAPGDEQEHIVDRTRDSMSGLLGRIRSLKKNNGGDA
ncbi:MAG: flagellar biosynthetic protein FliO [Phycisphaeraceae bacterium]